MHTADVHQLKASKRCEMSTGLSALQITSRCFTEKKIYLFPPLLLHLNQGKADSQTMSDDEADPELVALLRQSLGLGPASSSAPPTTGVLKDAEYIYDNSIDVAVSLPGTKAAARSIWRLMQDRHYSTETWSEHELHPKAKDETTVNFIFTMNLLNFSFWSELDTENRYAVEYQGKKQTGYWSLIAALRRALDEGEFRSTSYSLFLTSLEYQLNQYLYGRYMI
jgi:hypothetical protein